MAAVDIDARQFREVCSRFTTGVCVVTSLGEDGPSGMTANAIASLSLEPPMMIVCFDLGARTLTAVRASGRFAIHFLAHDQESIASRFASKRPERDKFANIEWSERQGAPALAGCVGGICCELRELLPGGDHLIAVGEVLDLWLEDRPPLVFFRGDYWRLGARQAAPQEVDEALEAP
jgi:3-hydroxy-9,10-secoandrosta-1,3,5(10)-triene-9,17-dione monooxygenase reductase component